MMLAERPWTEEQSRTGDDAVTQIIIKMRWTFAFSSSTLSVSHQVIPPTPLIYRLISLLHCFLPFSPSLQSQQHQQQNEMKYFWIILNFIKIPWLLKMKRHGSDDDGRMYSHNDDEIL